MIGLSVKRRIKLMKHRHKLTIFNNFTIKQKTLPNLTKHNGRVFYAECHLCRVQCMLSVIMVSVVVAVKTTEIEKHTSLIFMKLV